MKAIETSYKGYRFRSRLEARWAVFFDTLGIRWEYEAEGYDLGEAGWYLPDFWLPDLKYFFEVKGQKPSPEEVEKAFALANATGFQVFIASGSPGMEVAGIEKTVYTGIYWFQPNATDHEYHAGCSWCCNGYAWGNVYDIGMHDLSCQDLITQSGFSVYNSNHLSIIAAYHAARAARFE